MAKVIFNYGTKAQYSALTASQILDNGLYFLVDTGELYRGTVAICQSHFYEGTLATEETVATAQTRILNSATPINNDIMLIHNGDYSNTYIYYNSAWICLTAQYISGESIKFQDGTTLSDALQNANVAIDDITIEKNSLNKLQIRDYGEQYYKYVAAIPESGTVGEEGYVAPVAAHYDLQAVDATHVWAAGLELRTTADGIGWYEQNSDTVDGINSSLANLETRVTTVENTVNGLAGGFSFKGKLILTEGQTDAQALAAVTSPKAGDVWQIADKEYAYNADGEWIELGDTVDLSNYATIEDLNIVNSNALKGVQLNSVALTPVNGIVNIPIFSSTSDGIVPKTTAIMDNTYYLNAAGSWAIPVDGRIGTLTYNATSYNTVEEYVNAIVEDNALQWVQIA